MSDAAAGAAGAAAAGAGAGGAAAGGAAAPWYSGIAGVDDAMVGHWRAKGWDTKPAAEVAIEATRSWKAAEGLVGVPANQVVRLPKDLSDEAGWNAVWARLGKPDKADGYDFSGVKFADGTALDESFVASMRETAHKLHLPKDAATQMTAAFAKFMDNAETTEAAERTAKLAEQKAALKTNWGKNEAANLFIAQRAAAALGFEPEVVSALENQVGYDKVMEMFRVIGTKIGEDTLVLGGPNKAGVMTREEAVAKRADLMKDRIWTEAYLKGDEAKKREMTALNIIITGDTEAPRRAA